MGDMIRGAGPGGAVRVLVAEDDPEMLRVVKDWLWADGYDVREAPDGARLLIAMTAHLWDTGEEVDLVISDVRMPVCTGLEILERLRRATRTVPIVLMTAFGDEDTRGRAERLGAILLDKPFEREDLREAVRTSIARGARTPMTGPTPGTA